MNVIPADQYCQQRREDWQMSDANGSRDEADFANEKS
jgi:hypothetical protein